MLVLAKWLYKQTDKMSKIKFPTISSFLVAICIYVVLIGIIFINLAIFSDPAKRYTDDKDAFMDVLIDMPEISTQIKAPQMKQEIIKKEEPKPEIKEENQEEQIQTTNKPTPSHEPEPIKEPESKPIEKLEPTLEPEVTKELFSEPIKEPEKPNLKNLFSDIDTSKLKDEKKSEPQKVQSNKQSDKKTQQKPSTAASDIVKNLKIDKVASAPKAQVSGTYDPLLGAITKQIERKWRSYKANSDNIAKVKIEIDGYGNFSYEVVEFSRDNEFNQKVKECLDLLTREKFPFSSGKITSLNLVMQDKLEIQ